MQPGVQRHLLPLGGEGMAVVGLIEAGNPEVRDGLRLRLGHGGGPCGSAFAGQTPITNDRKQACFVNDWPLGYKIVCEVSWHPNCLARKQQPTALQFSPPRLQASLGYLVT